ncbi:MAG: hypothetical protein Q6361_07000 [Candidatus Hermodarchaeota archaeon]|nr:hypothetical protein [Candidatus Hermodarchaeota archaeon]
MKPTLENRPKFKVCAGHDVCEGIIQGVNQWFEAFEKKHRHIAEFPTKWFTDNKLAIMEMFSLHSVSGITPEELLVFFITKEVLGGGAEKEAPTQ